jgi:patatin-like phospholipase/acyl hydrolase
MNRILSLDGGGIRGALTLGYLQKIEDTLKVKTGNPNLRLCEYFQLIGGTSTGSIIAAALAIGMSVDQITKLYMNLGGKIFGKKYKWWNIFQIDDLIKAKYDEAPLEDELKKVFGTITLGDNKSLKTGLCIVAKRADTNSIWPLINHPNGKYFDSKDGKNKDILLWKAVRASTAAPTYFLPQIIDVGGGMPKAAFVDGGLGTTNNPALLLLIVATLKGFPYKWEWGADKLSIVSVGTGMGRWAKIPNDVKRNNMLNWAQQVPDMFMQDASWLNQTILQWMSESPTACHIDGEIGNLSGDLIGTQIPAKPLISYLRYNTWLDQETLKKLTGKDYNATEIDDLVEMSNAGNREVLYEIGTLAAKAEVQVDHFNTKL